MTSNHVEVLDIRVEVNETWIDGERDGASYTVYLGSNRRMLCVDVSEKIAIQRIAEVINDL